MEAEVEDDVWDWDMADRAGDVGVADGAVGWRPSGRRGGMKAREGSG